MPLTKRRLPNYADILVAAKRLKRQVTVTPVKRLTFEGHETTRVYAKCENLQVSGSFKYRGVLNTILQSKLASVKGIVAYSIGNLSAALSLLANRYKIPLIVLMPWDSRPLKIYQTRQFAAEVIFFDRHSANEEELANRLANEKGYFCLSLYDEPSLLTGAGTAIRELFEQAGPLDVLFLPLATGALAASAVLVAQRMSPGCRVIGVQPALYTGTEGYMHHDEPIRVPAPKVQISEVWVRRMGIPAFNILKEHAVPLMSATDQAMGLAMTQVLRQLNMQVEPTACLGLAAIYQSLPQLKGLKVGTVLTGGNISSVDFSRITEHPWYVVTQ